MEYIFNAIEKDRPAIKQSTIQTYVTTLKSLLRKSKHTGDNLDFLKDTAKTLECLDGMTFNSRRQAITSIVVGLRAVSDPHDVKKFYDDLLAKAKYDYMVRQSKKEMSERTAKQWTSMSALHAVRESWKAKIDAEHIEHKAGLTRKNKKILENYLISSLYTLCPPRRNIYGEVRLIESRMFNRLSDLAKRDNYLVFSKNYGTLFFYFGNQKSTSESLNNAKQIPPRKLKKIIRLYLNHNRDQEFLLMTGRRMLGRAQLGERVTRLFGIGTTMIRKIFVSEHTAAAHSKIDAIAAAMGHSAGTAAMSYVKTC